MSIKGNWRRHGSEVVIGWCQRFFSRRLSTLFRRFAGQCSVAPNEKKTSGTQGSSVQIQMDIKVWGQNLKILVKIIYLKSKLKWPWCQLHSTQLCFDVLDILKYNLYFWKVTWRSRGVYQQFAIVSAILILFQREASRWQWSQLWSSLSFLRSLRPVNVKHNSFDACFLNSFHCIFLLEFVSWSTLTPEEDQNTTNTAKRIGNIC